MTHLADCLREQQALLLLLLERTPNPPPGERAFSLTHLRRAVYAHLTVLRSVVGPQFGDRFPVAAVQSASSSVTDCLALLVASGKDSEDYRKLTRPLNDLFIAERALLTAAMLSLNDNELSRVGFEAEEQFEVLYGRGELDAERGASQLGTL